MLLHGIECQTMQWTKTPIRNAEVRGSTPLCSTNNSRHLNNLASDRQLGQIPELANMWPKIMTCNGKKPYAMGLEVKARVGVTVASISISLSLSRSRAMRRAGAPPTDLFRPSETQ